LLNVSVFICTRIVLQMQAFLYNDVQSR
jgi:hypothetical protein